MMASLFIEKKNGNSEIFYPQHALVCTEYFGVCLPVMVKKLQKQSSRGVL